LRSYFDAHDVGREGRRPAIAPALADRFPAAALRRVSRGDLGDRIARVAIVTGVVRAVVVRAYEAAGGASRPLPAAFSGELTIEGRRLRISWGAAMGMLAAAVMLATGAAYLLMRDTWSGRPVVIIAHRGASVDAPRTRSRRFAWPACSAPITSSWTCRSRWTVWWW